MADRTFYTDGVIEKGIVTIFAAIKFNATSAPSLANWQPSPSQRYYATAGTNGCRGATSITRNGVGDYTLTLQDKYQRVLGFSITFISNSNAASPIAQLKVASSPNAASATVASGLGTSYNAVNFLTFSAQGTAADPGNTELGILQLQVQNSTAL